MITSTVVKRQEGQFTGKRLARKQNVQKLLTTTHFVRNDTESIDKLELATHLYGKHAVARSATIRKAQEWLLRTFGGHISPYQKTRKPPPICIRDAGGVSGGCFLAVEVQFLISK